MYAELFCKSNFSLLRGASDSREYIAQAAQIGIEAIGIVDLNGVYALPRAFEALKEHPHIKLICGSEVTIDQHSPLSFIAKTREAYGLLTTLLTKAHEGKEKGGAKLQFSELIKIFENHGGRNDLLVFARDFEKSNFTFLKELFNKNLMLPLCQYLDGMDGVRFEKAFEISQKFDLQIVAHNDVHYHIQSRRPLQDCLTCVRDGVTIQNAGFKLFGNDQRYLKSPLQMRTLFKEYPEILKKTLEIADSCTFKLSELKYTYPKEFIPAGYTSQSYL
jgi:error-prone DNA polymerase